MLLGAWNRFFFGYLFRSSTKFQGHVALEFDDLDLIRAFADNNSSFFSQMAMTR